MLVTFDDFAMRIKLPVDVMTAEELADAERALRQAEGIVLTWCDADPDYQDWTTMTVPMGPYSSVLLIAQSLLDDSKDAAMVTGMDTDPRNPVAALCRKYHKPALA